MSNILSLSHIRGILTRLEETIIFGMIERSQFAINEKIYQTGAIPQIPDHQCLMDYLLHETERAHAKLRRYTSPDEHPFFHDLPAPILPAPSEIQSPLAPNSININDQIRKSYEKEIIPLLCRPGDDGNYGSSSVEDVSCLQAISRRIHYGKFVAESKFAAHPSRFIPLIRAADDAALLNAITDPSVEAEVIERVTRKAQTYCATLKRDAPETTPEPSVIVHIFSNWIIPLNKTVQTRYLLVRPVPAESP